jgi:hypothetical protein
MAHDQILSLVSMGAWAVALLVLGFVFAWLIGVRRLSGRIGFVVGFLLLGFTPLAIQSLRGGHWVDWFLPYTATQGGTELVFEVSGMAADRPSAEVMDRIVALSSRRVDGARFAATSVSQAGQNRIAVFLPDADADEIEHVREILTMSGTLEFAIVANRHDHEHIVRAAQDSPETDIAVDGKTVAKWRPIAPEKDAEGRDVPNQDFDRFPDIAVRQMAGKPDGFHEVLVLHEPDDARRITGQLLDRANPTHDANGSPAVGFHFNQKGGYLFHELTSQYKPGRDGFHRQLAVILNDQLVTAPRINQPIGADGIIESSRFSMEDVEDLVSVLNTGAMPASLGPEPASVTRLSSAPEYHLAHSRSGGLRRAALVSSTMAIALLVAGGALFWLTGGAASAADSFAEEPRQNSES